MRAFGAHLEVVHSPSGQITPDLIPSMMARAKAPGASPDVYLTDQFNNRDSLIGYETIGHELLEQFPQGDCRICGGVGVAGMLMGVARVLKSTNAATKIYALEPAASPVISQGRTGAHHVEGMGVGFVPPLLDRSLCDDVLAIPEEAARAMCWPVGPEEGLLVGTSSGLNVAAAVDIASRLGPEMRSSPSPATPGSKYMAGKILDGP